MVAKSRPDGRWGHADLAGNMYELLLDNYEAALPMSCADCVVLNQTPDRVIRGGSFISQATVLRTDQRSSKTPTSSNPNVGARCVHDL